MAEPIIVLNASDNVATAIGDLPEGARLRIPFGGESAELTVREPIPFGHKVALVDIEAGAPVLKYGASIGIARSDIAAGSLVHTHNVESRRGRGDLPEASK